MDARLIFFISALHIGFSFGRKDVFRDISNSKFWSQANDLFLGSQRSRRALLEKTPDDFNEICSRGHFVNLEDKKCERCPYDHYMPDALHSQLRCYPCRHAHPNSPEIDLVPCTDTADTIISCKDGHFLQLASVDNHNLVSCLPCTKCNKAIPFSYEIRPCGKSVDTVCCQHPDMKAVRKVGEYDYECQSDTPKTIENSVTNSMNDAMNLRTSDGQPFEAFGVLSSGDASNNDGPKIACSAGQFVKINNQTKKKTCETCTNGNYYDARIPHTSLVCKKCDVEPHNPGDIMGCISKKLSPVVIDCENGYYFSLTAEQDPMSGQCLRCTDSSDRKCCAKENMKFEGGKCREMKPTSQTPSQFSSNKDTNGDQVQTTSAIPTNNPESSTTPDGYGITASPQTHKKDECWKTEFIVTITICLPVIVLLFISHIPCVRDKIIEKCPCRNGHANDVRGGNIQQERPERAEDDGAQVDDGDNYNIERVPLRNQRANRNSM